MGVYLRAKFKVSSIILTSFRQGEGIILPLPPPTSKRTPKKSTQIRVKLCHYSVIYPVIYEVQQLLNSQYELFSNNCQTVKQECYNFLRGKSCQFFLNKGKQLYLPYVNYILHGLLIAVQHNVACIVVKYTVHISLKFVNVETFHLPDL